MSSRDYWEVRRDGATLAHGSKDSMPNEAQRRALRSDGHKIYVEGKLYREVTNGK